MHRSIHGPMRRGLAFLPVLFALGACSLRPDLPEPTIDRPVNWQSTREGTGVWPETTWWKGFGSAELDRLIDQAAAANLDLRAALARVTQAQANARIAGAALFPSIGVDAVAARDTRFTSGGTRNTTNSQAGITAAYEVDLFGRIRSTKDAAVQRVAASRFDREALGLTIHANVALSYFQLLALRERIALAVESLDNARRLLALLDEQRRIGTSSDLEVAQQRVSVAQLTATLPALRQLERETLSTLALLLGRLPQDLRIDSHRLSALRTPPVAAGMPSALLLRRPDVRRAEAELCAANLDVVSARAARFPRIQLTADGGVASAALGGLFGPGSFLIGLVGGLAAPIFTGGQLQGQEKLSRARYAELMETYRGATLAAFRDTENALSGSLHHRQQLAATQEARSHARDAYRLAELQYRAGAVDFLTVLDTQRSVISTGDAVVQAQLAQLSSLVELYKALGGGWDGATSWPAHPACAAVARAA